MSLDAINILINEASLAALAIIGQQNILLDAIDAYQDVVVGTSPSERLKRADMLVSVNELGTLMYQVANQLETWKKLETPILSARGFDENVLNEICLHFNALFEFMCREKRVIPGYDHHKLLHCISSLRKTNFEVSKCYRS